MLLLLLDDFREVIDANAGRGVEIEYEYLCSYRLEPEDRGVVPDSKIPRPVNRSRP